MERTQAVLVTKYRQRGDNVLLYVDDKFLLLPASAVEVVGDGLEVTEENLAAAYDLTPDLPIRVLAGAWRNKCVFRNELDIAWAQSVAQGVPGLSAHDIVMAFEGGM